MKNEKIGITTTLPIEVILASGLTPIDLNNIFISSDKRIKYIEDAEKIGFPRTTCSWIKGIYSACKENKIKKVIAVMQGDCSNTQALMEIFQFSDIEVIPFAYPYDKDYKTLKNEIQKLINRLGTTWKDVNSTKKKLDENIRSQLRLLDIYTWQENKIHGQENHSFLVSSSDFESDINSFQNKLSDFLEEAMQRDPIKNPIRIGYVGVPTIYSDLYEYIESLGGHIVFNEVQRQFSMPNKNKDIVEQYLSYTYPYSIFGRINDIKDAVSERKIDGIINYVQTFCFRHIEDIILRKKLNIPMLTIEGDKPQNLDARTKIRIETFIEMLKQKNN